MGFFLQSKHQWKIRSAFHGLHEKGSIRRLALLVYHVAITSVIMLEVVVIFEDEYVLIYVYFRFYCIY